MSNLYLDVVPVCLFVLSFILPPASTSVGDRSYVFHKCSKNCLNEMCESSLLSNKQNYWDEYFNSSQSVVFEHTILWDCKSECKYRCMWSTVSAFERDGLPVPQFNGKWPFVRLWGIQEPASAVFSFVNLIFICFMFYRFYKFVPFNAPMYKTWVVQTLFSVNAWIWSIVFHTRDTSFTEKMDYFSALAFVVASVMAVHQRIFNPNRLVTVLFSSVLLAFFANHVNYMTYVNFDYGYNMTVNISFGVINCFSWLFFSMYICDYKKQPYVIYCWLSVTSLSLFMLLELWDFVPIVWTFDSHALWHASSVFVIIPWYKFIIADCLYLLKQNQLKSDMQSELVDYISDGKIY
ncbi:unnamed protein product [Trichobilharzia szidati]|nr:unnamed protein product [Trichobilharzia szidati]